MNKLYKIGELAKACNTTLKTIRYYESKNLILPTMIDNDNGYHYYSFETLVSLQKILKLKDLGFTLEEIKNYGSLSNKEKIAELENLLETTNEKIEKLVQIEYTHKHHLPYFINDEEALGLWKGVAKAKSIEDYKNGNFEKDINNTAFKYLYFLNNGKGYDCIVDWSKGIINVGFKNPHTYIIENNKLYLNTVIPTTGKALETKIFERVDNITRDKAEPIFKDDVKLEFLEDKNVLGLWEIYDVVHYLNKENYNPNNPKDMSNCFFQSITFKSNGKCIREEFANFLTNSYTKGKVLNKKQKTASNYKTIKHNNETYLLLDYKSDEYSYDNIITWTYVFKKV